MTFEVALQTELSKPTCQHSGCPNYSFSKKEDERKGGAKLRFRPLHRPSLHSIVSGGGPWWRRKTEMILAGLFPRIHKISVRLAAGLKLSKAQNILLGVHLSSVVCLHLSLRSRALTLELTCSGRAIYRCPTLETGPQKGRPFVLFGFCPHSSLCQEWWLQPQARTQSCCSVRRQITQQQFWVPVAVKLPLVLLVPYWGTHSGSAELARRLPWTAGGDVVS